MCNLANSVPEFIPIYAHNSSKYDSHFLIKNLNKFIDVEEEEVELEIVPKTAEEYLSVTKSYVFDCRIVKIRFLDSCKFLPVSLDTLSSNLLDNGIHNFKNLIDYTTESEQNVIFWSETKDENKIETHINQNFDVKFNSFVKTKHIPRVKGIFPYDYIDSFAKYDETSIPEDKYFYNKLNKSSITEQERVQFKRVWNSFDNPNLGKYSDLYLKTDVLILADVFENFRNLSLKHYKLDPVNFLTLPSLSWQAMLNYTGIELELLHDYDMYKLFEDGIRGGISQVCGDRYVDVSDKNFITNDKIEKDDPNQEWLYYFDANNLYGHSMSQKLPVSGFKWMSKDDVDTLMSKIKNNEINGEEDEGYMLVVDIKYPDNKDKFINLPILDERKVNSQERKLIEDEKISEYTKNQYGETKRIATEKLILDFTDKLNYAVHIKNLLFYLKFGFKVKIKQGVKFRQESFLDKYIELNTKLRSLAKSDFEKDFFKLMNNSVFGKTMENVR